LRHAKQAITINQLLKMNSAWRQMEGAIYAVKLSGIVQLGHAKNQPLAAASRCAASAAKKYQMRPAPDQVAPR